MDVSIIGGTGAEGFGLTLRLAKAGHRLTIGSRDADRAAAKAKEAVEILGPQAQVVGAENPVAAATPVVIVTVPFAGAAAIYESIAPSIRTGTVVCDCTSPLMSEVGGRASHVLHPWHGSAAEFIRTLLPHGTRLVAAFHTVSAGTLRALDEPVDSDTLVMGDDADAKAMIGALVDDVEGMRWVDIGGLQMARIAEQLTPLLISINIRYKLHDAGFRVSGRDAWGAPG
jgi:8-hydroxy-5-deazaflavin:NADPH oxidoreductase